MEHRYSIRNKLAVAVLAIAAAACAAPQPIFNVSDATVAPSNAKSLQPAQVRSAIITAGTSLGWKVVDAGSGRLEGTLVLRTHTAVVDIPYNGATYSIKLKRSEGLMESDGKIHRNYNGWIQNLDRAIRTEISRL